MGSFAFLLFMLWFKTDFIDFMRIKAQSFWMGTNPVRDILTPNWRKPALVVVLLCLFLVLS
jgi:hypothetical protein